ncbi:Asp-tRNA(Asn)/Glu-tRNA(Gln) amidotransferase GatCAB subunit A, partial [Halomonas sp. ND22Bw]
MSANELVTKSVTELAPLIESKQVSPVEVTTALLDHAKALNPEINAYISFREQALGDARRAEDEISRGDYRGVFH